MVDPSPAVCAGCCGHHYSCLSHRPVKRDQLGQHDECDGSEVPEKPQRKSVSIHLSCMKSVGVSTVSGILDIFRESRVDLDLEIR